MDGCELAPVGPPVIERVLLCDLYGPHEPGHQNSQTSLPGHLLQLTTMGVVAHEIEGRRYVIRTGDLAWFHEDELVRVDVRERWAFYTLNFIAPGLPPPPFEGRVRKGGPDIQRQFHKLLREWRTTDRDPARREMCVQARLLTLLASLVPAPGQPYAMDPQAALWWQIETHARRHLETCLRLETFVDWSGRSAPTIARSCASAVGTTPMRRIKEIRLSLARGLVANSDLAMSDIASRIGYRRVHEFSRDFHKRFGTPPTGLRRRARVARSS